MFNEELRNLLSQVISSWQVWLVTVILVLYIFLVNYVAKTHHRGPRRPFKKRGKKAKAETPSPTDSDDLGLDESAL